MREHSARRENLDVVRATMRQQADFLPDLQGLLASP